MIFPKNSVNLREPQFDSSTMANVNSNSNSATSGLNMQEPGTSRFYLANQKINLIETFKDAWNARNELACDLLLTKQHHGTADRLDDVAKNLVALTSNMFHIFTGELWVNGLAQERSEDSDQPPILQSINMCVNRISNSIQELTLTFSHSCCGLLSCFDSAAGR